VGGRVRCWKDLMSHLALVALVVRDFASARPARLPQRLPGVAYTSIHETLEHLQVCVETGFASSHGLAYLSRRDLCSDTIASCVRRFVSSRWSDSLAVASAVCATARSRRETSFSNSTSAGAQLAFFKIEYAIRTSSGERRPPASTS
jgi:hypothetical protein